MQPRWTFPWHHRSRPLRSRIPHSKLSNKESGHLQRCPPCDEFAVQAAVYVLSVPAVPDQRVIGVNRVHVATHLFKLSWQPLTLSS